MKDKQQIKIIKRGYVDIDNVTMRKAVPTGGTAKNARNIREFRGANIRTLAAYERARRALRGECEPILQARSACSGFDEYGVTMRKAVPGGECKSSYKIREFHRG